jgi:hypothetical protein
VAVFSSDGQPGDEVMKDEVVQHDDAVTAAQCVDDPAVSLRIVADVEESDIRGDRSRASAAHDVDVQQPA